jgi:hypothetical protein
MPDCECKDCQCLYQADKGMKLCWYCDAMKEIGHIVEDDYDAE